MRLPRTGRRLSDAYRFPGFRPLQTVVGIFGEPGVRIVTLVRRSKKRPVACVAGYTAASTIAGCTGFWTHRAEASGSVGSSGSHGVRIHGLGELSGRGSAYC